MLFVSLLIGAIVLNTALVAWHRRIKQGQFVITANSNGLFRFETDLGHFRLNTADDRFDFTTQNGAGHCPISDVSRLEFSSTAESAFLHELFYGLDLTDLMDTYKDTIETYWIFAVLKDGTRFPVFVVSQYVQREFLMGWYIELQELLLGKIGLFKNSYKYSRAVYKGLWKVFDAHGAKLADAGTGDLYAYRRRNRPR